MNTKLTTLYNNSLVLPLKLVFRSARVKFVTVAVYAAIFSIIISFISRLYFSGQLPYYNFTTIFSLSVFYIFYEVLSVRKLDSIELMPAEKSVLPMIFAFAIFLAIVKSIKFHFWP